MQRSLKSAWQEILGIVRHTKCDGVPDMHSRCSGQPGLQRAAGRHSTGQTQHTRWNSSQPGLQELQASQSYSERFTLKNPKPNQTQKNFIDTYLMISTICLWQFSCLNLLSVGITGLCPHFDLHLLFSIN